MSRRFKTWRDPYGEGFYTCRPKEIEINEGLTVFVGCNGAGKSTLMSNIENCLKSDHIPVLSFNNLKDGGGHAMSKAAFESDFTRVSTLMSSSEGECLGINIANMIKYAREFIMHGEVHEDTRLERLTQAINSIINDDSTELKDTKPSNERWILLDAADSGASIDRVVALKDVVSLMMKDAKSFGVELYVIITANEYELANGTDCFDVHNGKYIRFQDYNDFRKFILHSSELVDKRYARVNS